MKTFLPWIEDEALVSAVEHLVKKALGAKADAEANFGKNVIDPFSALFELSGFEIDVPTWIKSETARQAQKTLQNHIGDFHQRILGAVSGWEDMKTGSVIDLVNHERKIIVELKNKHNTISGGRLADVYKTFEDLVMPKSSHYKGYTSYYVAIIPKTKRRYDKTFTPSDKTKGSKCSENELIREIDGASFYQLVTGQKYALKELYLALPKVIAQITGKTLSDSDRQGLIGFFDEAFS
ncbi:Eco47II family restriction endonuclease [Cytophagales bacterium LB-30]|uniref:Eco47II family restriction endonuclease n=1 Tax=Shiella aurantiaca TaxID=3058365 RepID=A0ABT8F586_9BACT|nr:Eco47II family restriction endonuclease [Shiella aurantiaca]MDN4165628.1 Eco47II family restriction endonuclease [Shiella aurantiaca]